MDLTAFADEVGATGQVTVTGLGTRVGPVAGIRCVRAPSGVEWIQADEMTVSCAAGTPVDELAAALAEVGQRVALPDGGTVGGALAVGASSIRRLGDGPVRETLLQARYVGADGAVVKAGGPTVKNVSGFDLCRLLVGSRGTLGFIGDVILRTKPLPASSQWFVGSRQADPFQLRRTLYHPVSILWDGTSTWVLLEGDPADIAEQALLGRLTATDGPPALPSAYRWSLPSRELRCAPASVVGPFVAEIGVGIVHHCSPSPSRPADPVAEQLRRRIKGAFDPSGRLNPAG